MLGALLKGRKRLGWLRKGLQTSFSELGLAGIGDQMFISVVLLLPSIIEIGLRGKVRGISNLILQLELFARVVGFSNLLIFFFSFFVFLKRRKQGAIFRDYGPTPFSVIFYHLRLVVFSPSCAPFWKPRIC